MTDSDDLALRILLTVLGEIAPQMDEDVVRQCYAVQKRHQFSDDRTQSSAAMERIIDTHVARAAGPSDPGQ